MTYQEIIESPEIREEILNWNLGRIRLQRRFGLSEYTARQVISTVKGDAQEHIQERHPALAKEAHEKGLPIENVKHYWYKGEQFSVFTKTNTDPLDAIAGQFEGIVAKYANGKGKKYSQTSEPQDQALKVTTTDDHLGLDPDPDGNSLFQYRYGADDYKASYEKVFQSVMKEYNTYGKFDFLLLDNLGDEQDGYNGLTTRGGFELPQNMSNGDVFHTCVDTKVELIQNLVEAGVADKVILRKVTNDNHSGDFGLITNLAIKKIINLLYSSDLVEVQTLSRFMEHRTYGNHCFILTHGKDKEEMKSGLPLHLDNKTINYVNEYLDFYEIEQPYIHVQKGDLHQAGYSATKRFDYRSHLAFSPPSKHIQTRYGDNKSGYSVQVVPKWSPEIAHTDYFLDYKKKIASKEEVEVG